MTVRVETLDALISSSTGRTVPLLRSLLSMAVFDRVAAWWQQRGALVMSDEWLQELRTSHRDEL
jgi:hypothetical protein